MVDGMWYMRCFGGPQGATLCEAGRILKAYAPGTDSKNAYVVLSSPEAVLQVAKQVNNLQVAPEHRLRADGVGEASKKFDRKRSVFLGALPRRCSEHDVRWVLSEAGELDAVRVIRDRKTQESWA